MNKHRCVSQIPRVAAALFLAAALTACTKTTLLTATAPGHRITAEIEGTHAIETRTTGTVVSGQYGAVTIEQNRMRIGDAGWVKIADDAPVAVRIVNQRVTVKAGNVSMEATTR
jgi:hypothetical protein